MHIYNHKKLKYCLTRPFFKLKYAEKGNLSTFMKFYIEGKIVLYRGKNYIELTPALNLNFSNKK